MTLLAVGHFVTSVLCSRDERELLPVGPDCIVAFRIAYVAGQTYGHCDPL
jgi:hypothetical protein